MQRSGWAELRCSCQSQRRARFHDDSSMLQWCNFILMTDLTMQVCYMLCFRIWDPQTPYNMRILWFSPILPSWALQISKCIQIYHDLWIFMIYACKCIVNASWWDQISSSWGSSPSVYWSILDHSGAKAGGVVSKLPKRHGQAWTTARTTCKKQIREFLRFFMWWFVALGCQRCQSTKKHLLSRS